jgi:hypothetical protein
MSPLLGRDEREHKEAVVKDNAVTPYRLELHLGKRV